MAAVFYELVEIGQDFVHFAPPFKLVAQLPKRVHAGCLGFLLDGDCQVVSFAFLSNLNRKLQKVYETLGEPKLMAFGYVQVESLVTTRKT